ncbi:MAG: Fis family transcriptional regulator [Deltaproteobacteria bacterium HGW-Deltaproteobacteria-15]|nr:MAG: Fis family transcriptional regulator [Deltaproteobacteria bacterium HGW-Deltaproteobacteria-15]
MADSREYEFFMGATTRLCGSLDIETALREFLLYARDFMPLDQVTLNLLDFSLGLIRVVAGATAEQGKKLDLAVPLSQKALSDLSGHGGPPKVRLINRLQDDLVSNEMSKIMGKPDSSLLILRVKLGGKPLGSVVFRCDGTSRYTADHSRLVSLLNEPFAIALSNFLRFEEVRKLKEMLADDNRFLQQELRAYSGEEVIGRDFGLRSIMEMAGRVAPMDSPVLLLGETGTGKEVIASAIHHLSARRDGPFIKVNCGAIPETLVDSELFGHEKGAFTGAISQKRGRFERAHKGTLFLDEIGELRPEVQVRLLRVLQQNEIERVGGSRPILVDIRVIAATHRNLERMVSDGLFREDLYYRISVFPIRIPPLRHRKMDIPVLVRHILEKKSKMMGLPVTPSLAQGALDQLTAYEWPGNVRELENVLERELILCKGGMLHFSGLTAPGRERVSELPEQMTGGFPSLNEAVSSHINRALERCGGKIEGRDGAALLLAMKPSTLRNRMKKLGIGNIRRSGANKLEA